MLSCVGLPIVFLSLSAARRSSSKILVKDHAGLLVGI
jgi:hypothetical protein